MKKLRSWFYYINIVGMVLYLVICGGAMFSGHPLYPGQTTLLGEVGAGIILASLPLLIEHFAKVELPPLLVTLFEIFILMSILLGSGMQAYSIPHWDKYEHLFSAAMLAGIGFMIYAARTPDDKIQNIDPLLISLFGTAFGSMLGVCWEFYEFTGDSLFGMNMQRYMANGHPLVGHPVLYDTMGDLAMDVLGSALLGIYCYFAMRKNPAWLKTFMLRKKETKTRAK